MLFPSFPPPPCFALIIREMLATDSYWLDSAVAICHGCTSTHLTVDGWNKGLQRTSQVTWSISLHNGRVSPSQVIPGNSFSSLFGMTTHSQYNIQDNLCLCFITLIMFFQGLTETSPLQFEIIASCLVCCESDAITYCFLYFVGILSMISSLLLSPTSVFFKM